MNLKLVAKYALLQAPSKHENLLVGSGGDSRTGKTPALLLVGAVAVVDIGDAKSSSLTTPFFALKQQFGMIWPQLGLC